MPKDIGKRGKKKFVIILIIFILLVGAVAGSAYYFIFDDRKSLGIYSDGAGGRELENPAAGLSLEEAVAKFDESFVYYLLVSIGAYNLHNLPFSSNEPKIEISVDSDIYSARIVDGSIRISEGGVSERDIVLRTTKEEAIKMMNDRNYVVESFRNGKSEIELIAGELELFSKGYLELYDELSQESA